MKPEEVGNYLKQLRLEHELTQKELASKLHITHQAVSNWEKGKALPDISILSQLGDVYGVSIDNLLLKESSEDEEPKEKPIVLRRVLAFFGLVFSLEFIAIFLYFDRHIVTSIVFVVGLMILSVSYSYIMRERKWLIEYAIITFILIVISLITIPSNLNYYMMNDTQYLQTTEQIEISYHREFDELTQVESLYYMFDRYALIYTEAEEDIDVFNLSNYYEGEFETIETPDMNIYDLVVIGENDIYFTTFDESIPGEFKLYQLDFESQEFTLLYESQEVLRMYKAFEHLYFVSDPHMEPVTNIYEYNIEDDIMYPPVEVGYQVFGLAEYFADYESYLIMSVTNLPESESYNAIALFDYAFEFQHIMYEEEPGLVHLLFSDYGQVLLGTEEGAIVFDGLGYYTIGEEYARWPKILSPEFIRLEEELYLRNWETEEYELFSTVLFYDENYDSQGARFLIDDESEGFYAIDNGMIALIQHVPREIDEVEYQSTTRIVFFTIGILSYGFFLTLGHKRKKVN